MNTTAPEIYFCSRRPTFEQLDATDIAPATRAAIRRLCRCDSYHGWVIGLFGFLWIAGASASLAARGLLMQIAGCGLSVTALLGLSIALHEASHRLLFRNAVLNEVAGFLCGIPVLIPVSAFRTNHRLHHARRGSRAEAAEETLDFALFRTLPIYCLGILIKSFGFVTVLPVIAIVKAQRLVRLRVLGEYALLICVVACAVREAMPHALWSVWGLPLLITALLSQTRAIAEHGLTAKGNVFTASRTVVSSRVLELLMCNINYHLEHHLFPALPWYNLPRAHALLQEEYRRTGASVYRSYRRFFADFLKATWRGVRPHARLISIPRGGSGGAPI